MNFGVSQMPCNTMFLYIEGPNKRANGCEAL